MNCLDLTNVDPMFVRRFTPTGLMSFFGGVLVMDEYNVEDVGPETERREFDEGIVDCSNRIFQITSSMMLDKRKELKLTAFTSRRFRNLRVMDQIVSYPNKEVPLLFIGNPIRLTKDENGITVYREPSYLIKTGMELGY